MTRMTRLFGRTTVCGLCLVCLAACKDAPQQSGGAQYKTLTLSPTDRTLTREYTAVVEGRQSVEIRPQVSGTITEVCINEGAKVGKGQPLFIIDQVPYRAALETAVANVRSAEAAVATARMTADSKQTLFDNKVVSAFDLQTAKNSLLEAEAALAQAKAQETSAHRGERAEGRRCHRGRRCRPAARGYPYPIRIL